VGGEDYSGNNREQKTKQGKQKEEKWKENFVYLFKDMMLCAKKMGKTNSVLGKVHFHGKVEGFYKFSKTKAVPLNSSTQLTILHNINDDEDFSFKLTCEKQIHEFKAMTPQARTLWLQAMEKTVLGKGPNQ